MQRAWLKTWDLSNHIHFTLFPNADKLVADYRTQVQVYHVNYDVAHYMPGPDYIELPRKTAFLSAPAYYQALFHELVHSTGHSDRLFRTSLYLSGIEPGFICLEQMSAELGSIKLLDLAGILTDEVVANSEVYIAGYYQKLGNNRAALEVAEAQALQAAAYIINH